MNLWKRRKKNEGKMPGNAACALGTMTERVLI